MDASAGLDGPAAGRDGGTDSSSPVPANNDEIYDPTRLPRFDIDLPQASIDVLNR